MIQVIIERLAVTGYIAAFSVSGHARYANTGKDIVCAGVSAVSVGTVNSVEVLTGVELPSKMKDGLLQVKIPDDLEQETSTKIQLLLESMVVMLDMIQKEYGKYMKLKQQVIEKRR
ncbi:MAG: ribosomal protein [Paenibacillus sp.]|jgi:uncharacterized protein YsxB (DUF464 family)|nr:ribosomal protein [Paenibacillus sp.]